MLSGLDICLHVIYYDTEPHIGPPPFYLSGEGGRYGVGVEVERCLKKLAQVGRGRFHHFKVSGSCEGEEIAEMVEEIDQALCYLQTARKILEDYKDFCRRVRSLST